MSAQRREVLRLGFAGAALAALARAQSLAAASTALYRNQLAHAGRGEVSMTQQRPIVELRQYTLQPGARERFVELFEREFIEAQEQLGYTVIGQFRDLDDANRFVWLRAFPDMETRARALTAFYVAPSAAWKAHREEANAMIIDSDNVLLLHATRPTAEFALDDVKRAPIGASRDPDGLLVATIYYLDAPADAEFIEFFERDVANALDAAGIRISAYFATETAPNNFPRLPVRQNEPVFVWFTWYRDAREHAQRMTALNATPRWHDGVAVELRHRLKTLPQTLRLTPTPRSLLHG
jgi:hypothetical protein